MKTLHWLFLVSVLLFVSGIGFVIAAGRTMRSAAPEMTAAAAASEPVADVRQVMIGMTGPSAQTIWNSVSTIVSSKGIEENQPRTDEEWEEVVAGAAVLAESANLLMTDDRAIDQGEWITMAQAMADSARKALTIAEKHDPQGILDVGEEIYNTCNVCHGQYSRE